MLNRGHAEPGTTLWPMAKLTPFAEYWSVLRVPAPSAREALSRVARASWAGAASGEHSSTKVVTRASTLPISGLLAVGEPGANRRGGHAGGHPRDAATASQARTAGRLERVGLDLNCHEIVLGHQGSDGRTTVERAMRARPIVVVQPGGQRLGAVARRGIGAAVGPLAQEGLDEALGFGVRARGVGPGAEVAHTSTAAEAGKAIRAIPGAVIEYEGMRKREATSPPCSGYPFSRLPRHEGGAHMPDDRCRLGSDDVVIGLDLASAEHQVVVLTADGRRLTRFKIPHSRVGLEELLRRTMPAALSRTGGSRVFAFEATGHVWEAVAYILRARGERYVVINPLTTFRVREARQLSREKTDLTDAEQIAELCRSGLVTRTQLVARPYLALRRAWGEYRRLREERARLKVLVAHQLYGLFPEFLRVWADLLQPGALAVLRTGLTPATMAALSLGEFVARVREHRARRRVWRFKLAQVPRYAEQTIACPDGDDVLAREVQRAVARIDVLTAQMTTVATEVDALLADLQETPYLRTIPGLGWASVAGLLAHVGAITKYRHGRQLINLAGTK